MATLSRALARALASFVLFVGLPAFAWAQISLPVPPGGVQLGPTEAEEFPVPGQPPATLKFGAAVALDGVTALIGMPDFGAPDFEGGIGRVAIFTRVAPGQWKRTGSIDSPVQELHTRFGARIAFDGNLALIGTPTRVFLYQRTPTGWQLVKEIAAPAGELLDGGLAVERESLLVGASADGQPGVVHVLARQHAKWRVVQNLHAFRRGAGDFFGARLATSHGLLVAGAPGFQDGQGAAFVYLHLGAFYFPFDRLLASDRGPGDGFGAAVATDGNLIAVGAPRANDVPTNGGCPSDLSGQVYVYATHRLHWLQRDIVRMPDEDCASLFGTEVALSRGIVAASIPAGFPSLEGGTFVFTRANGTYVPTYKAVLQDVGTQVLAFRHGTLLIGAPVDRFFAVGTAGAFELDP